ncbi:unnamed protein product [Phytophthora fragariaefolia]|uniref:Unnamed protein product n=1 Tax=Phytophthora fragariaefolia TaxID=1490495 RepID=A0A9W7D197_9STRA|nr:unnamed protein product [Phytophthora fragariaefolia]
MTAELDAGMDITVELVVDEATKDVLDNGVEVRVELRTGAEATTGSADEGALVTTPDVGKGARSMIDGDTASPAELANPMIEAVEHDADNPTAEDTRGRDVAESTVGAAETTVVTGLLEVAVTGLEVAATTLDVPVVDTTLVEEVTDTPTSTEASSSTSSIGSPRSKSKEASSPAALAGRATLAAELRVTELEAR